MPSSPTFLTRSEGESWESLGSKVAATKGDVLLIFSKNETILHREEAEFRAFLEVCAAQGNRVQIASKHSQILALAREKNIPVIDRVASLSKLLAGHDEENEYLRIFSPHVWQQQLRSRLQSMGLLSLPKIRIWTLIIVSISLFLFVIFRLLPSADVQVWPRGDTLSQTVNIFLVQSGATVELSERVRTMELVPITVDIEKTLTFDEISKEFTGESAEVAMTVINKSTEEYSLRRGTRLTNQAGMVFRLEEAAIVQSGSELTVRATAEDLDLYGEVIGERGNIPANKRWEFPGLAAEERTFVYAENRVAATKGTTSAKTVLHEEDLVIAEKKLQQELTALARQLVEENRTLRNSANPDILLEMLNYDELTRAEFHNFVMPTEFLGQTVSTIPVSGKLKYTAFAYDSKYILDILHEELRSHVGEGKRLLDETVSYDRLVVHVIDYNDELTWIKLTVDLSGTEQAVLEPLSPAGARFAKHVRESIVGLSEEEAISIISNLPEVSKVEITFWPPWNKTLPTLPSHITITPVSN